MLVLITAFSFFTISSLPASYPPLKSPFLCCCASNKASGQKKCQSQGKRSRLRGSCFSTIKIWSLWPTSFYRNLGTSPVPMNKWYPEQPCTMLFKSLRSGVTALTPARKRDKHKKIQAPLRSRWIIPILPTPDRAWDQSTLKEWRQSWWLPFLQPPEGAAARYRHLLLMTIWQY